MHLFSNAMRNYHFEFSTDCIILRFVFCSIMAHYFIYKLYEALLIAIKNVAARSLVISLCADVLLSLYFNVKLYYLWFLTDFKLYKYRKLINTEYFIGVLHAARLKNIM